MIGLALAAGCGGGGGVAPAETVEISGMIKIDGQPTENVEVYYVSIGGDGRTSGLLAVTDGDGKYSLPEVLPGEYRVQVDMQRNGEPDPALKKYKENSPLRAEVSVSNTNFDFDVVVKK